MNQQKPIDVRRVILQQLETDRQLGLRALPLIRRSRATQRSDDVTVGSPKREWPADALDGESAQRALEALDQSHVRGCRKCGLCESRSNTVFGVGDAQAQLVFVGEAPGFEEDRQAIPFVGRAGQLLTRMILAMGLRREDVYICNVLKCRPPNNRDPAADEIAACSPYLFEQLSIIKPEVIVALGAPAARTLLNSTDSIGRLRGTFHEFAPPGTPFAHHPIPVMATYHPAYLLRQPGEKSKAWADLQLVMRRLGLSSPPPSQ